MNGGIFISPELPSRLKDIFEMRSRLPDSGIERFTAPLLQPKANFDDFYVALYVLSLVGRGKVATTNSPSDFFKDALHRPVLEFEVFSDIPLDYAKPDATFDDTLFDEFDVADAYNLRDAIQTTIPLENSISQAALGCLYLKFTVLADPHAIPNGEEPLSFNRSILESSSAWRKIMERYKIKAYHTLPLAH
jgi:hypothetical protein